MAAATPLKRAGRGLALFASGDAVPLTAGGTGANTAPAAATALGLGTGNNVAFAALTLAGGSQPELNVGLGTATQLGGLSNYNFYAGFGGGTNNPFGGVAAGAGPNGNSPFLAATRTGAGSATPLSLITDAQIRAYISAAGSFGIGTTNPSVMLDVAGAVRPGTYTVATLPAGVVGAGVYVSNGRKVGEASGSGTGVPAYFSNGSWRRLSDDTAVAA